VKNSLPPAGSGGNQIIMYTIIIGIEPNIINGFLRPHLVFARSERYPINGSLKAFHEIVCKNPDIECAVYEPLGKRTHSKTPFLTFTKLFSHFYFLIKFIY